MSCKCKSNPCCCTKVISRAGMRGKGGKVAKPVSIIVEDNVTTVSNVKEIRFTDANAVVTDLGGGVAQVNFTPAATVWTDVQNIPWYVAGSESIKPQYIIEGNKITFRGILFIPGLTGLGGSSVNVSSGSSYLSVPSAFIDETRVSVIANANNNNGTPQGRFMTTNAGTLKNLPTGAIPVGRDIVFSNLPAIRRYEGARLALYRSVVQLRIGSTSTVFQNGASAIGSGCIMVFSHFQEAYVGGGAVPLGNDPYALLISNVTSGVAAVDYVTATDNSPFTVPASLANNEFDVNAHKINQLGGFYINLEGLSGYLN